MLRNIFDYFMPEILKVPFWQPRSWQKKRKVGKPEGIAKGASAGYRQYIRSKQRQKIEPVTPTANTFMSADGRCSYRIWSDGTYRKMVTTKGRRIIYT